MASKTKKLKVFQTTRNVKVRDVTATKGKLVKVAVQIDNSQGCLACDIFFSFDAKILKNPRVIIGTEIGKQNWSMVYNPNIAGQVNTCMYGIQPLAKGYPTLMELHFDLTPTAKVGDKAIINFLKLNINENLIPAIGKAGSVTVI